MSTTSAPFGLRPSYHPSGEVRPRAATIASAYANNIFLYSPVAYADGVITLAAAGARAIGCFMGCAYTPTDGRRRYSNSWPAATVATEIVCWITDDPTIIYEIQAGGSIAQEMVGEQADWSTNDTSAGNTITGLSNVTLNTATLTDSGNAGLRIVGISVGPDNAFGDAFTVVQVQISEHQNVADRVAY